MLRLKSLPLLALLGAALVRAQTAPPSAVVPTPPAPATAAAVAAELAALEASAWRPSVSLRTSVGWRDNLLLSPFAPLRRAFGRGEMEAIWVRPMRHHWEWVGFLNGDVLRYFSPPPETGGEQQWVAHAEVRWQPVEPLRLSLKAVGYLRDMVVDLSETESRRVVVPTRVRGGYVAAAPRLTLPAGFRFEPVVQAKRSDYRDYSGDYAETRAGGRLEWRRTQVLVLSAAGYEVRRRYDQRNEYTAGGRALPGTLLRFYQRDGEVRARSTWRTKAGAEWTASLAAGALENRDGASGYFDFDQRRGRLQAGWQRGPWRVNLEAEGRHLNYRNQTVGAGLTPPARINDDHETTLRFERETGRHWTWFAEHHWERSRSNETEFSYRANTVLAGVQRGF